MSASIKAAASSLVGKHSVVKPSLPCVSTAQAPVRRMSSFGVPRDRMILEDQAETTKENFLNTAKLISPSSPVVLVSSDYHMDRAVRTAKNAGFSSVLRLPAPSSRLEFGANVMWEVVLELNELLLGR